jgi:hypothetical protein
MPGMGHRQVAPACQIQFHRTEKHHYCRFSDARSAEDGTLLMSYYYDCSPGVLPVEFDEHGHLPPKNRAGYDFRVHHTDSEQFQGSLLNAEPEVSYPLFFGYPGRFTNDAGVFKMRKVERFLSGE